MNGYKRRYKILRAMKVEKGEQYKDRLKRKKELDKKLINLDGTFESDEGEELTQEEEPEIKKSSNFLKVKPFKYSTEEINFKENKNIEAIELKEFNENEDEYEDEKNDDKDNENVRLDLDNHSLFSIEQPEDDKFDTDADQDDLYVDYESDYVSEYGEDIKSDVAF
jgi:hypothetical protein